jgi:hypothetical protein
MVLLDPDGHRFDRNQGAWPPLHVQKADDRGRTRWQPMALGVYPTMFPRAYSEAARKGGWIEEHNERTHQGAPFMYRFRPDWLAIRYVQGKAGETVGVKLWDVPPPEIDVDGSLGVAGILVGNEVRDAELGGGGKRSGMRVRLDKVSSIDAVYCRAADRTYGIVQLLPEGTTIDKQGMCIQPVDGWMALAFCKDDEWETLARRWVSVRGGQQETEAP